MKNEVLKELVSKWRHESKIPECKDGSPDAEIRNAREDGTREGLRKAAEDLEGLISLLSY